MSPPDDRNMSSCSRAVYSKRRTHNYGGVRRIGQKRSVTGIRHDIGPAKFHGLPDIDVAEVSSLQLISVTVAYLSMICA
jgi:hypothetical protein